jgi:hypothetical protein
MQREKPFSSGADVDGGRAHRGGQVILEYFILFAVVAFATLLAFASFRGGVRQGMEQGIGAAAEQIARDPDG